MSNNGCRRCSQLTSFNHGFSYYRAVQSSHASQVYMACSLDNDDAWWRAGLGQGRREVTWSHTCIHYSNFCWRVCSLVRGQMQPNQSYPNIGIASTSRYQRKIVTVISDISAALMNKIFAKTGMKTSLLVFSQTAAVLLAACLSHAHTGVTSPCHSCCHQCTLNARQTD